jgi:NAD(P)-dependent dehydrogenase (short-subunit alcohol dehydrogenase family)
MGRNQFRDRVVIITGSTRGIGRATAAEMAGQGATVVLNGRNRERLEETRKSLEESGCRVLAVPGDVTSPEESNYVIDETIKTFGRIDVLINNAGIIMRGAFEDIQPEVFQRVIQVNLLGSVYPTMAALPFLRKTCGSLVFISSIAGLRGFPMASPYSASKMALTALAESLKVELAGSGVHVGVVHVSFTENDPDKKVLSGDGSMISVAPSFQVSQVRTARGILRSIGRRRFRSLLTPIGKLAGIIQWAAPRFGDRLLTFSLRRMNRLYQ